MGLLSALASVLAVLIAADTRPVPPDTSLAALYGPWETSEPATYTGVVHGTRVTSVTVYRALDLTAEALTETSVGATTASQPGWSEEPHASEIRYRYRADSLTLTFPDGARARLRPDGDRLGVTWTVADSVRAEVVYTRAVRPHPLAGRWGITSVDEAGVPAFVLMTVSADGRAKSPDEESLADARVAGGFLIYRCESMQDTPGGVQGRVCQASSLRKDGDRVVVEGSGRTWMTRL